MKIKHNTLAKMNLIAFYSAITCVIPVIGPSVYAYILASNEFFNDIAAVSKAKLLGSILFGVVFFTTLFELRNWPILSTLIVFTLNILVTSIFFFVGVYKKKRTTKSRVTF